MITFSSSTYLKNVNNYKYYQYTNDKLNITIKKVLDVEPYIINEDGKFIKILDNNYYVMEIIPIDENYILRIHLDDNKKIIERYFIMSLKNEFKNNIPTFNNLKISYVCCDFQRKIYNDKFLDNIYNEGKINKKKYIKIKKELEKIIKEIENNENEYYNLDYKQIIEKCEVDF